MDAPAVAKINADRKEEAAEFASWKAAIARADYLTDLVGKREAACGRVVDLYSVFPWNTGELRILAGQTLRDGGVANRLVDRVTARTR